MPITQRKRFVLVAKASQRYVLSSIFSLSIFFSIYPYKADAGGLDIDLPGIFHHFGSNKENPAYQDAPRGLDKHGVFVLNPGVGFGYGFRSQITKKGFSAVAKGVYL